MYTADELEIRCAIAGSPRAEQLIACLEGEIAKRDARIVELESDLAGTQSRVLSLQDQWRKLDAELAALKAQYQRDVWGLNNEGDPIGGEPAGGYANDNARLHAELAAIKAQDTVGEVAGWYRLDRPYEMTPYPSVCATWHRLGAPVAPLYSAPVSEAKAQGVVLTDEELCSIRNQVACNEVRRDDDSRTICVKHGRALETAVLARLNAAPVQQVSVPDGWKLVPVELTREMAKAVGDLAERKWCYCLTAANVCEIFSTVLAAAPAAPAADAGIVDMYRHLQKVTPYRFKKIQDASITDGGDVMYFHKDRFDAALLADMAAHCAAKGVV